jgi:hypothetical protein
MRWDGIVDSNLVKLISIGSIRKVKKKIENRLSEQLVLKIQNQCVILDSSKLSQKIANILKGTFSRKKLLRLIL